MIDKVELIELEFFLSRYSGDVLLDRVDRPPNLSDSLAHLQNFRNTKAALNAIPAKSKALIEGYSCPANADGLRKFLTTHGATDVDISAVDIYDLPTTYQRLGLKLPEMNFFQGSASNLKDLAQNQSYDVVVQDFLLNCVPPAEISSILTEAFRILKPCGHLILSITDNGGLKDRQYLTPEDLKKDFGLIWNDNAKNLRQIINESRKTFKTFDSLHNSIVLNRKNNHYTFISAPYGRFEFFIPWEATLEHLSRSNFKVIVDSQEWGRDDQGLECCRHRVIAIPDKS